MTNIEARVILNSVLSCYQNVLARIEREDNALSFGASLEVCKLNRMELGICEFMREKFGDERVDELKSYLQLPEQYSLYRQWCWFPLDCKSKDEIIYVFKFRIANIKHMLCTQEKV